MGVGVGETVAYPGDQPDDFAGIDCDAMSRVEQRFSRHKLHDDVEHAVDLADVVALMEEYPELRKPETLARLRDVRLSLQALDDG